MQEHTIAKTISKMWSIVMVSFMGMLRYYFILCVTRAKSKLVTLIHKMLNEKVIYHHIHMCKCICGLIYTVNSKKSESIT